MVSEDIRARVISYIQHQAQKSTPALAELVATSQARFLDVVDGIGDDVAARAPGEGEWSLRELVRHVIDAQGLVTDLVSGLSRGAAPQARGGLGMMAAEDGRAFAGLLDDLRRGNAALLDAIRGLPEDADVATRRPHPWFGELNCREWAAFQRVHDEDHVQHAQKIVAAINGGGPA